MAAFFQLEAQRSILSDDDLTESSGQKDCHQYHPEYPLELRVAESK